MSEETYEEYYRLPKYNRRCLIATNWWRIVNGLPEIKVPPEDERYHKYATEEYLDKARETRLAVLDKEKRLRQYDKETNKPDNPNNQQMELRLS